MLATYKDVTVEGMRANLIAFVREIAAVAEEEGARLAIHPDDPAFPLFGLPRVCRLPTTFACCLPPFHLTPMG